MSDSEEEALRRADIDDWFIEMRKGKIYTIKHEHEDGKIHYINWTSSYFSEENRGAYNSPCEECGKIVPNEIVFMFWLLSFGKRV